MHMPPWLQSGINFACQGCGACCTGDSGTIYVSPGEVQSIARFLQISPAELIKRHLYPFQDSYSIREYPQGDCHFYAHGCRIYPVRPWQCRSYPFWFKNLRNEHNWRLTSRECPGIGQGQLYSSTEILCIVQQTMHI